MSVFHFRHFDVVNDRSAMKVNTDGVLLGALMTLPREGRMIDVGTGTGTIALMAAQRCPSARVDAIDLDEASAEEASINFSASPWPERLRAHNMSLDEYDASLEGERDVFDAVFSNPPYFDDSLLNPDERKSDARHTSTMSYREILAFAEKYLKADGRVAFVLPSEEEKRLCREARSRGFFLGRIVRIRTTPKKQPRRIVAEFTRLRSEQVAEEELVLMDPAKENQRTREYADLMSDFYTN